MPNVVGNIGRRSVKTAQQFPIPTGLSIALGLFLLVQSRVDKRDPRLAAVRQGRRTAELLVRIRSAPPGAADLSPLTHRLAVLQGVRALMALFVLLVTTVLRDVSSGSPIVLATSVYVLASAVVEFVRRRTGNAPHWLLSLMLLADGGWIAYVLLHGADRRARSGSSSSSTSSW